MSSVKTSEVKWPGREELTIEVQLDSNQVIQNGTIRVIGSSKLIELAKTYRPLLKGDLKSIPLPQGTDRETMCFREALLKLRGEWNFPYQDEEICHCRAVPTEIVDQAICSGAHSPQKVSRMTSASTACGTCRPDVAAIIKYRIGA